MRDERDRPGETSRRDAAGRGEAGGRGKGDAGAASGAAGPQAPKATGRTTGAKSAADGKDQAPRSLLPAVTLPKGGGAIRGIGEKFSANPATGTGSLTVPIAVSPGRPGFELGLELSYDSGSGNGPFGLGWRLSTPAITRKTDKGLPRYLDGDESDTFILSGAEDLVPVPAVDEAGNTVAVLDHGEHWVKRYRPRVEGLFARIERWTHKTTGDVHWRVTTRDNVTNIYGQRADARVANPEDPRQVFSWLLQETRDDRGNIARYDYATEDGAGVDPSRVSEASRFRREPGAAPTFAATAQRYLSRLRYGNRQPLAPGEPAPDSDDAWLFEVVFDYGERAAPPPDSPHALAAPPPEVVRSWPVRLDPFSSYRAGFEVRTYRLCRRVLVFHRFAELGLAPYLVRSTDLAYDEGPAVTYLRAITQAGYEWDAASGAYRRATLPSLELGYAKPPEEFDEELHTIDRDSLTGIAAGVDGSFRQWVDLDGEGLPGVLTADERAWYYKRNEGEGRLAPPAPLPSLPSPGELQGGAQLTDLAGDGQLDLVRYGPPLAGYFTRTAAGEWESFAAFRSLPRIDWNDPNLRFVDLDGDGQADVLVTEDDALVWYRSRAEEGFAAARRAPKPRDERRGPAVVFADGTETLHLADMSGDGLVDLVRVRNGEVCYWPNLGYGRFGPKVTLERSPTFDAPDQFDPRRVRFADLDGSGTSDVLYLGREGVQVYLNQAGNTLSERRLIRALPVVDAAASISAVDLLGRGTSCLVWSSPLPAHRSRPLVYVDPMGGTKPHLLTSIVNNLGAETRIAYAPSTRFYLDDRRAGRPWLTRLGFPVQVVERVEHCERITKARLVTRYRYHHGYFDGHEREFGGFACVEQWDAESFGGVAGGLFPEIPYDVDPADEDLNLPPVRTVTWFHTGAWLERERLETELAKEYYGGDPRAPLLPDTVLPAGLSAEEERQAARALRGRILRQEIYAEDATAARAHPYTVSEREYEVRLVRHAEGSRPAVLFVHPRNTVDLSYERKPADPRVQHELVLEVDEFGNVTHSARVAYPRRAPAQPEQGKAWVTFEESTFANRAEAAGWYRVGVPIERRTSELVGLPIPGEGLVSAAAMQEAIAAAAEVPFEATAAGAGLWRRVFARERRLYYRDDLGGPLGLGEIESRALPYETYRGALTPGLLAQVFGAGVDAAMLAAEGRYVQQDGLWWAPSGRVVFDASRFYLPVEALDAFGERHLLRYDGYALLALESEDPLHNVVTVGLRNTAGQVVENGNDYRVLGPALWTDANGNRTVVAFDVLGMVVKTAVMGKEGAGEGDTLAEPTTRLAYGLHAWRRWGQPSSVTTLAREEHGPGNRRWQESHTYSDGMGREVLTKVRAEPGLAPAREADGTLKRDAAGALVLEPAPVRWVGTGRRVFDNKGNAVKQYEPFFSSTAAYEDEEDLVAWGVTPIFRYDPLGRLVRTDQPNGTHARVVFDAWERESWDENDTVAGTPWLGRKQAGSAAEQRNAALALAHAGTPARAYLDALGREFLVVADTGTGEKPETRMELDVEGNARTVTDARGNRAQASVFAMGGQALQRASADAGESRVLVDVGAKPVRTWTARGYGVRRVYDGLQRPTHVYVAAGVGAERLVERVVYGEGHGEAEARNLRGQVYQGYDGSGVTTRPRWDFEGNALVVERRMARAYREAGDWSVLGALTDPAAIAAAAESLLESESLVTTAAYDALQRITSQTTPEGSETRPVYNEAGLLERLEVRVRGAVSATPLVTNVDYNARGQRERVVYGNGVETAYAYDPQTFRLVRLQTVRATDGRRLQELEYEHDPVGNVVEMRDGAQREVYFGNAVVSGEGRYAYDGLYRLMQAEGREHPGQQPSEADQVLASLPHPNDTQALRRYVERYAYDGVGNILSMAHEAAGGGSWTRRYQYAAASNRLQATSLPGDPAEGPYSATYEHDASGNMTRMPHLSAMEWDWAERLQRAERGGGGTVYYGYDGSGSRVRKVYEHSGLVEERLYVGGYEVYRKRRVSDGSLQLERQTLGVMDGERRVALVETKTVDGDAPPAAPVPRYRYQLDNHLGSSAVELDEGAQVITYEEYYPYGGTSFHATASGEVSAKRYRYTGKERDEETGLYYFGARYYAAWLGRWTAADPAGMVDGPNLYWMTRDNPVRYGDHTGRQAGVDEPELTVEVLPEAFAEPAGEEGSAQAEVTDFEEEPLQLQPLSQEQWEEWLARREGSPSQSEAEEEGVMAKAVWNWLAKMAVGFVALPALFFMGSPEGAAQAGAQLQNMEEALRVPYESELGEQLGGGTEQVLEYGTLAAGGVGALSGAARHVARRVAAGVGREAAGGAGSLAARFGTTAERVAVLERAITAEGGLNTSATVARQLAGQRSFIPTQSILDTIGSGARIADPQGVAGQFMYRSAASFNGSQGTLEVLVHEASGQIRHVLFRSGVAP